MSGEGVRGRLARLSGASDLDDLETALGALEVAVAENLALEVPLERVVGDLERVIGEILDPMGTSGMQR